MESKKGPSSEIDLVDFINSIGNAIKSAGNSSLRRLSALRRMLIQNKVYFIIVVLAGLVIGTLYTGLFQDRYEASVVIQCNYLNNEMTADITDRLNEMDKEELSRKLGIDLSVAQSIRGFKYETYSSDDDQSDIELLREQLKDVAENRKERIEAFIRKIEDDDHNMFTLTATVSNSDFVEDVIDGLIKTVKNNDYIKKRIESDSVNMIERKAKLTRESLKLDSLKYILFGVLQSISKQPREGSNNVILGEQKLTDPLSVFNEDLKINKEIATINKKLYTKSNFEIVDRFSVFTSGKPARLVSVLVISFLLSLLIGYLILGAFSFNRYLASLDQNS